MPKLKLNCRDLYDQVRSMMKTRYDNDITNCTNAVNAETNWVVMTDRIKCRLWQKQHRTTMWLVVKMRFMPKMQTKLLWPIGLSLIESCPVFDQKKERKSKIMTLPIILAWYTLTSKLNHRDLFDWLRSVMKTKQNNDVTHCTDAIYVENETKLLWAIGLGAFCEDNQIRH